MKKEKQNDIDIFQASSLLELPSVIRYYDDFNDRLITINDPNESDIWLIINCGSENYLDFTQVDHSIRYVIKCWIADLIQTLASATVIIRYASFLRVTLIDQRAIFQSSPTEIRTCWNNLRSKGYSALEMTSLKSILFFICTINTNGWSSDYSKFLSTLPLPAQDKYSSVRTGEAFLSIEEEEIIVSHIDEISLALKMSPNSISDSLTINACILLCAYQFGMRPEQIGMLQMRDVRVWRDVPDPSVHLTFKMVKQKSKSKALPLTRKVKHEWSILFIELMKRNNAIHLAGADKVFRVKSSKEISQIIINITDKLLPKRKSARKFRHTAAQRMVDAGASHEELAEFLGHSQIDTGIVYFQTSPNQAELVNRALGISKIYKSVAKVAHDRFISPAELSKLKGDQQIGGVPHGYPITGIGGCSTGQPICPSNPILACYGCRKFMPINDVVIHQKVLDDFREIVSFYSKSSRGESSSPAYMQLTRTISNIQSIIAEIEIT